MNDIVSIIKELPDSEAVQRSIERLEQAYPAEFQKLVKNHGLLSDVLTLAAYSPLLAATLLQNPHYIPWLNKRRIETKLREKEELLEALARFTLTNSSLETHVLLSRFQRRELLRIYLRDIRGLGTISEITEELSNLADAILEHALRLARQELDNRYGSPQVKDDKGRDTPTKFIVVSLGKLGSKELNYASDIDLLFLYSHDGMTSGAGNRGAVSNKEYFIKLSELVTKLVGQQAGEGAAYRVDLRLRPHGRIGALALSLKEALEYYRNSAGNWERQVLLRARGSAGDVELFKHFYQELEDVIYQKKVSLAEALETVRVSKLKIDLEHKQEKGFNVKLGRGGIREIEFIAQAPQLALGNSDPWLRAPHTLISLSRLADRSLLSERELTQLSDAYAFLRTLEHRVQMENGWQTHAVPEDAGKKYLLARRMSFPGEQEFAAALKFHTDNVSGIYRRVFVDIKDIEIARIKNESIENGSGAENTPAQGSNIKTPGGKMSRAERNLSYITNSLEKYSLREEMTPGKALALQDICALSDYFSEMLAANPALIDSLSGSDAPAEIDAGSFYPRLSKAVEAEKTFREEMAVLRTEWAKFYLRIGVFDLLEKITMAEANALQTQLAEASIETALLIVRKELFRKFKTLAAEPAMAVLALGRLGGRGMDYGSDLDLVLVYDETQPAPDSTITHREFYHTAAEIFTTVISSFTRQGYLYRVDLRLRPDGKNGALCSASNFFLDYVENRAAPWEWLAYVKLRLVGAAGAPGGAREFGERLERQAKEIIHRKAIQMDNTELRQETLRVRLSLEKEKTRNLRNRETHIKYSAGGLLDIYFLIRYLQLSHGIPDEDPNRSTMPMLKLLKERQILNDEQFQILSEGYLFLRRLDHALRLVAGRATRLPDAGHPLLNLVAKRFALESPDELVQILTSHRVEIRQCFEEILG